MIQLLMFLSTADPDTSFTETVTDLNFPGLVALSTAGITALIFIVRWMLKFQQNFTNFYIDENNKLRERIDEAELEAQAKDQEIRQIKDESLDREMALRREIGDLTAQVARQGEQIVSQEQHIARLERRLGITDGTE